MSWVPMHSFVKEILTEEWPLEVPLRVYRVLDPYGRPVGSPEMQAWFPGLQSLRSAEGLGLLTCDAVKLLALVRASGWSWRALELLPPEMQRRLLRDVAEKAHFVLRGI